MVVGTSPGVQEMKQGKLFVGQSGKLLDAILRAVGWPLEDCYVTNLLCWVNNKPTDAQVRSCSPRLYYEIQLVRPKLIVALGKIATEALTGRKFSEAQGCPIWSEQYGCWVMGTNHPAAALYGLQSAVSELVRDLSKIPDVVTWEQDKGHVDFEVVHSPGRAQEILNQLSRDKFVALDVETVWGTYDVRCLAVSDGNKAYTFSSRALYLPLDWPTDVKWTYHNAEFDTAAMRHSFGVELPIVEDTMLMSYSLDERTGGNNEEAKNSGSMAKAGLHGLKRLSREYCGAGFYEDGVDLKDAPEHAIWEYNAKDAAYTARLAELFYHRQIEDGVREMYLTYLIDGVKMTARQRRYGIPIDRMRLLQLGYAWAEEMDALIDELQAMAWEAGWDKDSLVKWNSPTDIAKVLYDYIGLPYTSEGRTTKKVALEELADLSPFVAKLLRYRVLQRLVSTYVEGLLDDIDEYGRVHPTIFLNGTVTGRWSYRNPPLQTIPKHRTKDNIRQIVVAPEGYEILQADYRQAELWTAYIYSRDPMILEDLAEDFHAMAAQGMFEVKKEELEKNEWEEIRDASKTVTFGVFFGRQARAVGKAIKRDTEFAQRLITNWFERYKVHGKWYKEERQKAINEGEQVALSGRKRRYHLVVDYSALNQAVNFPIQATSHDNLFLSMLELYDELIEKYDSHILFEVHDSIIIEVRKEHREEVAALVQSVMEKPRFAGVGIPVEIKIGPDWANLEDYKTEVA